ncbi:hypothetical protein CI1B_08600 [Bradyrhizobium ivorense]|uniref:Uncharacterized protein n=1 Tax=Bradyrhizobium ivorense TaxID=2511166 RepID=A0A508STI5_9BRAD|nr:hypothetical protein CI1B_08600 [Bradyrhizobium ivorense]
MELMMGVDFLDIDWNLRVDIKYWAMFPYRAALLSIQNPVACNCAATTSPYSDHLLRLR